MKAKTIYFVLVCIFISGSFIASCTIKKNSVNDGVQNENKVIEFDLSERRYLSKSYPSGVHPESDKLRKISRKVLKWAWEDQDVEPIFSRNLFIWIGAISYPGKKRIAEFVETWDESPLRDQVEKAKLKKIDFWADFARVQFNWIYKNERHSEPSTHYLYWIWDQQQWRIISMALSIRAPGAGRKWREFFWEFTRSMSNNYSRSHRKDPDIKFILNRTESTRQFYSEKNFLTMVKLVEYVWKRDGYFPVALFYKLLSSNVVKVRKYVYKKLEERYGLPFQYTAKQFDKRDSLYRDSTPFLQKASNWFKKNRINFFEIGKENTFIIDRFEQK